LTFFTPTPSDDEPEEPAPQGGEGDDEVSFGADAWVGGFLRGDAGYLGRPWTAIYGAQSDYPRATLVLALTNDPTEPVDLVFDGLDDEAPGINRIALDINGQRVYRGDGWFAGWDGIGDGANVVWTTVRITIPPDLLVKGDNRITISNLSEAANFSSPPYILVAEGSATSFEGGLFGEPPEGEVVVSIVVSPE